MALNQVGYEVMLALLLAAVALIAMATWTDVRPNVRRPRRARLCWSVKRSAFMGAAVLKYPSNSIVCAPSHVRRPNR